MNNYSYFHINTSFSSIEKKDLKNVINSCYYPLLDLIEKNNFKIGVEASGNSLIEIEKLDKNWIEKLKTLIKRNKVEFIGMPKGVKKFKTKINKDAEFIFKKKGVYLYQCTPHKAMGMIGLVIVGNDKSNLDKIKKVKLYGKSKKIFKKLLKEL